MERTRNLLLVYSPCTNLEKTQHPHNLILGHQQTRTWLRSKEKLSNEQNLLILARTEERGTNRPHNPFFLFDNTKINGKKRQDRADKSHRGAQNCIRPLPSALDI